MRKQRDNRIAPSINVQKRPITKLTLNKRNPRTHTEKQVDQIADSINRFGFINPILHDEHGKIIAGHGRFLAAQQLGLSSVPAIQIDYLTEAQIRAYIIADNRLAQLSGWDNDILAIEFQALADMDLDFDLTITGFELPEIDILLQGSEDSPDPDDAVSHLDTDKPVITQPGDTWRLGNHFIGCGDIRDQRFVHQMMCGREAQLVFTDPPYNVKIDGHVGGLGKYKHQAFSMASGEMSPEEFTQFLSDSFTQLIEYSHPSALHYLCMDWRHIKELQAAADPLYAQFINLCVWAKMNGGMGSFYRSQHELIFVYQVGKGPHINNIELGRYGRYRTNVWSYPGMNAFGSNRDQNLADHPTVKPIQLVADAIMDASHLGDIVFDGFLGAGTTLLAAERTQRTCIGIEIEPRYVDISVQRWEAMTGKKARLSLRNSVLK